MRRMYWFGSIALLICSVVFAFGRAARAGVLDDCYPEYASQKKLTSENCINATKDIGVCRSADASIAACASPLAGTGLVLPGLPTCDQLLPYLQYFVGQCQRVNPSEACGEFGQGPGGCCITRRETAQTIGGACTSETEQCADKSPIYYSCCYCQKSGEAATLSHMAAVSGQTYESCEAICKTPPLSGTISHSLGAGTLQHQATAPPPQQIQKQAMYCFTAEECASEDYVGTFQSGAPGCQSGEGRCIAPEPEITLSYPIGNVTTVKGYRNFISTIFQYMIGIVGIVAAVAFVWGGFRYIFGSAFENIARAKEIMVDSAIGLILVFSAVAILRTINPATLNLNKLDVFMINKSRILSTDFCKDIKSSKPIEFAKAGARPELIPFGEITDANFTINKDETLCGEDYYAKGFGEFTCAGMKCPGGKGICHKCVDAADCPQGTKKGASVCEEGNFGGNITYSDCRYVNSIKLMAVCEGVGYGFPYAKGVKTELLTKDQPYEPAASQIVIVASRKWNDSEKTFNKTSALSSEDSGNQRFLWTLTQEDLDTALKACEGAPGGVHGFFLGIKYQDPGSATVTAISGVCGSTTVDEVAIVGKNNCGSDGILDGYYEGEATSDADNDRRKALWCSVMSPGSPLSSKTNWDSYLWTVDDLQKAIIGEAIQCNFTLSRKNAIVNPLRDKNYMNNGKAFQFKDLWCPIIKA